MYLYTLMNFKLNWDRLGIFTSVACAIHCGILPILFPILPLFGVNIIHNGFFEWFMIAITFVVGCYSLYHGFVKHHHNRKPFIIFAIGFCFLVVKQFYHPIEYLFLVFAVSFIVSAHMYNFKLSRKQHCDSPHHKHE